MKHELFQRELDTIKFDDIKEFGKVILDDAPEYFFNVSASSTNKYHPDYAIGEGGLARHSKATVRFYNHLMNIEQNASLFTERQIALGVIACMAHDIQKSGTEEYYLEKSKDGKTVFTVFEHPLLAAKYIMSYKGKYLSEDDLQFIALAIGSHMGQWNTNKNEKLVLPKPVSEIQKMVHLADYLASRKDIEVLFSPSEQRKPIELPDINEYEFDFGKYKGEKLLDVAKKDTTYINWCLENMRKEPLFSLIKSMKSNNTNQN